MERSPQRLPGGIGRSWRADESPYRRRGVGDAGNAIRVEWLRGKEHAAHEIRVERTMIAAPNISIVLEHRRGRDPEGGLPGDPIARSVGHDEIGNQARVVAAVDLLAPEDSRDGPLSGLRVSQLLQSLRDLRAQSF